MSPLDNVRILEFPGVADPARGVLTVAERLHVENAGPDGKIDILPFPIKRIFYIHSIPDGGKRGGHSHTTNREILICLHGAFDLTLSDSVKKIHYHLDDPAKGVVIPPDVWTQMENFAPETILLVLCSEEYTEEGYIHDLARYKTYIQEKYGQIE